MDRCEICNIEIGCLTEEEKEETAGLCGNCYYGIYGDKIEGSVITSYLSKIEELKDEGYIPIVIMRYPFSWVRKIKGVRICKELSPTDNTLKLWKSGEISKERFNQKYREEIDMNVLAEIVGGVIEGNKIALLCCEKNEQECHRSILAEIMYEVYGLEVKEW